MRNDTLTIGEKHGTQKADLIPRGKDGIKDSEKSQKQPSSQESSRFGAITEARQKEPRLVLIEWEDSVECSATWEDLTQQSPAPLICKSVGWLIHQTKECYVVVPHITTPHEEIKCQGCGEMTIPTRSVLGVRNLSLG